MAAGENFARLAAGTPIRQSIDCPVDTDIISMLRYSSGLTDAKRWCTGSRIKVSLITS